MARIKETSRKTTVVKVPRKKLSRRISTRKIKLCDSSKVFKKTLQKKYILKLVKVLQSLL